MAMESCWLHPRFETSCQNLTHAVTKEFQCYYLQVILYSEVVNERYCYAYEFYLQFKCLSHTSHVIYSIRAPVSPNDGGEDVVKGVKVFGGN